ncbi:unnamed protein product [Pylaiella littoralis]
MIAKQNGQAPLSSDLVRQETDAVRRFIAKSCVRGAAIHIPDRETSAAARPELTMQSLRQMYPTQTLRKLRRRSHRRRQSGRENGARKHAAPVCDMPPREVGTRGG